MSSKEPTARDGGGGQLMKDCHELRRRLMLTEESLRSLGSEQDAGSSSTFGKHSTPFERPQSESGFFYQTPSKARLRLDERKFNSPSRTASLPDINLFSREPSTKFSLDTSELSFQVHQMNEKISFMAQIIKEKEIQIRDLHRVVDDKDRELDKINSEFSIVDDQLLKETSLRKSIEEKLKESLYAGEELKEKVIDLKNHVNVEKDTNSKEMEHLKMKVEKIEAEKRKLAEQNEQLKNILRTNDSFRDENRSLRSELESKDDLIHEVQFRLSSMDELQRTIEELQKENEEIGNNIETLHVNMEDLTQENERIKAVKEDMEATIYMYEEDLEQAKQRIASLEKEKASNISKSPKFENSRVQDGATKMSMAESELKLALKDAEIHKLQAALLSRAATNLKNNSLTSDGNCVEANGLRSEFAAFLERSKIGDRKQQDLERIISHLEDEVAKHSDEIMILEERLTDKMSYISLLEGKLEQKNSKMTFMQDEIKKQSEYRAELEKQLQSKDNDLQGMEKELQSHKEKLSECTKQIESFESVVSDKIKNISYLENVIKMKDSEGRQANHVIEKIKSMNSENCQQLQLQIDSLQEQVDVRNLELTNAQAHLTVLQQELDLKSSVCSDLEGKLNETTTQLEDRASTLAKYEENLEELNGRLKSETGNVEQLQRALSDCKDELKILIEQTERDRKDYSTNASKQRQQGEQLEQEYNNTVSKLETKTNELNESVKRLTEREKEINDLRNRLKELENVKDKLSDENETLNRKHQSERQQFETSLVDFKSKFSELVDELKSKDKENAQLRISLEEVQVKSGLEAERREDLEKLVKTLSEEKNSQESLTKSFQSEAKEKESSNKALLKKFQELKRKCASEESLHKEASSKANGLEQELVTVQTELRQTVDDLSKLQSILSDNEKEIQNKEETISIMDRKLNESQENIQYKDALLQEQSAKLSFLDKSLKEQQLELKQKAVEVTQLDMSMKEQHSQLQHRLNATEEQLQSTTHELSERLTLIAELQAKFELAEEKLESRNSEIEKLQQSMQQLNRKLREQAVAEVEMQRENNILKSEVENLRHLEKQLDSAIEEKQLMLADLRHLKSELSKKHQIEEDLTQELDDCHVLLQSKEADCTRLAKNLGASQVREAEQEAKWMHELQKIKSNLEFKNLRQQQEAEKASSEQSKRLAEREKQIVGLQAKVQHIMDENKVLKNDLQRFRNRISEQGNEIKGITNQLQQQQQYTDDLKENSLIKDAEIARLEARMSGFQRATHASYNGKLNSSFNNSYS